MKNTSPWSQSFWQGLVRSLVWLAKALVIALALYIFFPPLWDALFAANLEALHKAPYRAADRARHLWQTAADTWRKSSDRREADANPAGLGTRP